ncbi:hypothetical protein M011DRAFT_474011 [Sporormia fimetaria CBS 119925]|uniref:Uncharacterized protein n=1 Tax=Sporormia fimetaria CBS 119925 TaxID=1340428 RepID=A0A6A6VP70_9PLEO|nr:hypothetical protein M011DRAFT_474011 [Sporormia fimetaria CBS 119925]
MQNAPMAAMAAMNANPAGPADASARIGHMQRPVTKENDPRNLINTYIYDHMLRNQLFDVAKAMIDSGVQLNLETTKKQSPGNVNGVDPGDASRHDLPPPVLPGNQMVENSFLSDWWCQFWDIFSANRGRHNQHSKHAQYIAQARNMSQVNVNLRDNRMSSMGQIPPYANLRMPNGVDPNGLKRAALNNNRPNGAGPMANMNPMNKQAMLQSAQMQRDGSNMDLNRGQSPASVDNAPSPNKRPRMEGGMNAAQFGEFAHMGPNVQQKPIEVYAQALAAQTRSALNNHAMAQNMNVQGSPLNPQGLEGADNMYTNQRAMPAGAVQGQQGNHALQDYQMQLMLLEQQNKKRLLMARQEQETTPAGMPGGPHGGPNAGPPGFGQAMSPQGSRQGPSPNPTDMKRGTPKLNQSGLPTSPMPDGTMPPQRGSPAPGMSFDVNQIPPGMPPQYPYGAMAQNAIMRPPSSHPGNFNPQALSAQQLEAMRNGAMPNGVIPNGVMPNGMPNGAIPNGVMANPNWRGPIPQGMMPGQPGPMAGPMGNVGRSQMPPPPAPPAGGEMARPQEPSPSQPAPQPPTPVQANKANPKKKAAVKDTKKPAKGKAANTGATPAASSEDPPPTPTPSTPITPMHSNSFAQKGQPNQPPQAQPVSAPQQPALLDNNAANFTNPLGEDSMNIDFGDLTNFEGLENNEFGEFDFDIFMTNGNDEGNGLANDFSFPPPDEVPAGGDL